MMNAKVFLILFLFYSTIIMDCSQEIDLYVAQAGSDTNPGTKELPVATIEKAKEKVRILLKDGINKNINVWIGGGKYTITGTIIFTLDDSPQNGRKVIYRNIPDEKPVLSAGVPIMHWSKFEGSLQGLPQEAEGKLWTADFPDGIEDFYTLYDGDERLNRARTKGFTPTEGPFSKEELGKMDLKTLRYPAGAIRNWLNLSDVELIIQPSWQWCMNILELAAVDEGRQIAQTAVEATYPLADIPKWGKTEPETAWIENVPEGLSRPGRWIMNSHDRKIYYWPENDLPGKNILIPSLREIIRVEGNIDLKGPVDIPVKGIHIEGLIFTHADRGRWSPEDIGIQHDWEMLDKDNAMLRFRGAEDCSVTACRFFNSGGNGIRMDLHAQNIVVKNCWFHDLGQSAVMMIGYGPGTKDVNKKNSVINNLIHHCGQIYWHSQQITAWQSGDNTIAHNLIHDVPRKGICLSGVRAHHFHPEDNVREEARSIRWHEVEMEEYLNWDEAMPNCHARNNVVEYNQVYEALQMLGDGAVINLSGTGEGNIIRKNYVHDIYSTHFVNGLIRTDGYVRGTTIESNILFRSNHHGITI